MIILLRFPDLPNLSNQIWTGNQGRITGLPTGRCDLTGLDNMLEGFYLAQKLGGIAANFRSEDFHGPDHKIGINYETAPDVDSSSFIVNAIYFAYFSSAVRDHGEGHSTINHFRKFFFLPDLMHKTAVCTEG